MTHRLYSFRLDDLFVGLPFLFPSDTFLLEGHLYEQHYEHWQCGGGGQEIRSDPGTRQRLPRAVLYIDKAVSIR